MSHSVPSISPYTPPAFPYTPPVFPFTPPAFPFTPPALEQIQEQAPLPAPELSPVDALVQKFLGLNHMAKFQFLLYQDELVEGLEIKPMPHNPEILDLFMRVLSLQSNERLQFFLRTNPILSADQTLQNAGITQMPWNVSVIDVYKDLLNMPVPLHVPVIDMSKKLLDMQTPQKEEFVRYTTLFTHTIQSEPVSPASPEPFETFPLPFRDSTETAHFATKTVQPREQQSDPVIAGKRPSLVASAPVVMNHGKDDAVGSEYSPPESESFDPGNFDSGSEDDILNLSIELVRENDESIQSGSEEYKTKSRRQSNPALLSRSVREAIPTKRVSAPAEETIPHNRFELFRKNIESFIPADFRLPEMPLVRLSRKYQFTAKHNSIIAYYLLKFKFVESLQDKKISFTKHWQFIAKQIGMVETTIDFARKVRGHSMQYLIYGKPRQLTEEEKSYFFSLVQDAEKAIRATDKKKTMPWKKIADMMEIKFRFLFGQQHLKNIYHINKRKSSSETKLVPLFE